MSEQLVETQPVLVPPILRWFHILEVVEAWVLVEVGQVVGRQVTLLLVQEVMVMILLVVTVLLAEEATALQVGARAIHLGVQGIHLGVRVIHLEVQALHLVDQVIHPEVALLAVLLARLVQADPEEVEVVGILIGMVNPTKRG